MALVISPSLNPDLREMAKSIVAASPALRDWEFHSARQPKKWDFKFELENPKGRGPIELEASIWKFVLLKYPDGTNEILLKAEAQNEVDEEAEEAGRNDSSGKYPWRGNVARLR
jgi:hypothetical protein